MANKDRIITEPTVRQFDEAFMMGMTDREACLYVGVAYSTFTSWLDRNEEYRTRKEELKLHPKLLVKKTLYGSLKKNEIDTAKWYAERKMKDEGFNAKQEIDLTSNITLMTVRGSSKLIDSEEE